MHSQEGVRRAEQPPADPVQHPVPRRPVPDLRPGTAGVAQEHHGEVPLLRVLGGQREHREHRVQPVQVLRVSKCVNV